ncbi:Carbamate kinase [Pyrodictium delaneyi]|uniref:Carbamate kinase n=1 Tax=Pyrodictium delaneyi TaxID=1273541 RepID=A0A0P0N548_9CREN|nr:carbamate kinase [Pyrodictium delaneyi]ALL01870.1 Carbamate kinase [Pyrodictium delaneyi]OWJ54925.1 carbamate kinase [Pyrodictium delaneyi]
MDRLVVVALGGNAFARKGERLSSQWRNVRIAAEAVAELVERGYRVVVTHGNGPQVGMLLEWMYKASRGSSEPLSMDVAVAMTQGWLGYMLQQAIGNALKERGLPRRVAAIVTQVLVRRDDPAFREPSKPIGPYYTRDEAERLAVETGWVFKQDPRGGYRRVVPSPRPAMVVELEAVKALLGAGYVVIAAGGGGVPVVQSNNWLHGLEAVVDKDYASSLLARTLEAYALLILTDVPYVYIDYGKPGQKPLEKLTASEARRLIAEGQFPPGSMGPKVEAAVEFVEARARAGCTDCYAAIGRLEDAALIAEGKKGTVIVPG